MNRTKTKNKTVQSKRQKPIKEEGYFEEEEITKVKSPTEGNRMVLRSRNGTYKRKVWTEEDDEFIEEESKKVTTSSANPKRVKKKGDQTQNQKPNKKNPKSNNSNNHQPPITADNSPNSESKKETNTEFNRPAKRQSNSDITKERKEEIEDSEAAVSLMGLADIAIMTLEKEKFEKINNPKQSPTQRLPPAQTLLPPTPLTEDHKIESSIPSSPPEKPVSEKNKGNINTLSLPSFACFKLYRGSIPPNLEPDIIFNSKRISYKRCSTHVAIAYYIFFRQRVAQQQQQQYSDKMDFSVDPTLEARLLKEKTEKTRSVSQNSNRYGYYGSSYPNFYTHDPPRPASWNMPQTYNYVHTNFQNPVGMLNSKDSLTLPPVKNPLTVNRGKLETLLDNSEFDRNVNLFPKIIVNPEDTKLSTMVNPNLLTTHEIKTTHISSHQSQLPIDQKQHLPPYEDFHVKLENSEYLKNSLKSNYPNMTNKFIFPSPNTTNIKEFENKATEGGEISDLLKHNYSNITMSQYKGMQMEVPPFIFKKENNEHIESSRQRAHSLNEVTEPNSENIQT